MTIRIATIAAIALAGLVGSLACADRSEAATLTARVTEAQGKPCRTVGSGSELSTYTCKGVGGRQVRFDDTGIHGGFSFGPEPGELEPGFWTADSLPRKIEWRMDGETPLATLVKVPVRKGELWVVTRLEAKAACRAAYVNALVPDAEAVARELADVAATEFRCGKDRPVEIGRSIYEE